MTVLFQFTIPDDAPFAGLSLNQCQKRLEHQSLSLSSRLSLLRCWANQFLEGGDYLQALTILEDAIVLQPDSPFTLALYGLALEHSAQTRQAIQTYQQALNYLSDATHPIAAQLWYRMGTIHRSQKAYKAAIASYDRALALCPDDADTISGRGVTLALTGHQRQGLKECDRAVAIDPDSATVLNNRGIALMAARQLRRALTQFDQVLTIQPNFAKAQYNSALVLLRLGQELDALDRLNRLVSGPFSINTAITEPWKVSAWTMHAFLQLKQRQFQQAIASCRQAQQIQPQNYAAALYKLIALVATGTLWSGFGNPKTRQEIGQDFATVGNALKYRFLGLGAVVSLLLWGQGSAIDALRAIMPIVLSVVIITLIGVDLWQHKTRLSFVWKIYFRSGWLTYLRALLILIVTLFTFSFAYQYAPGFMRWGWAEAVFGFSGNIIFQPINVLQDLSQQILPLDTLWTWVLPLSLLGRYLFHAVIPAIFTPPSHGLTLAFANTFLFHIGDVHITVATILTLLFWVVLLVGVPFWANLEERIFRQGANTWQSIAIRSTQFGLVHLLAGIPLIGGVVLIVPGFLFACRYKYVRDRHYHRHHDPQQADAAGVLASTADHAVYNAILMTLAIAAVLLDQVLI